MLKRFRRGAVVLLLSYLAVCRALSHAPNSPARSSFIIAWVYDRHRSHASSCPSAPAHF